MLNRSSSSYSLDQFQLFVETTSAIRQNSFSYSSKLSKQLQLFVKTASAIRQNSFSYSSKQFRPFQNTKSPHWLNHEMFQLFLKIPWNKFQTPWNIFKFPWNIFKFPWNKFQISLKHFQISLKHFSKFFETMTEAVLVIRQNSFGYSSKQFWLFVETVSAVPKHEIPTLIKSRNVLVEIPVSETADVDYYTK